jgi:two-component sensor histidine kinase
VLLKTSWVDADLREVTQNVTSRIESPNRFGISGPPLVIGPRAALSLSLLLHELSTNSIKYGSLSAPDGRVVVSWRVDGGSDELVLSCSEHGGPPVRPPGRRGFGSRLIATGLVCGFR